MHEKFAHAISSLHQKFESLQTGPSFTYGELPVQMPTSGVYMFSEESNHLYVGRSNRLRKRYFLHCRPGSRHNQASFAFKLAKESINAPTANYKTGKDSRAGLALEPEFVAAFILAKERIRRMQYRYVEETDQTRQALLEAYCIIALSTPFNDFDTH